MSQKKDGSIGAVTENAKMRLLAQDKSPSDLQQFEHSVTAEALNILYDDIKSNDQLVDKAQFVLNQTSGALARSSAVVDVNNQSQNIQNVADIDLLAVGDYKTHKPVSIMDERNSAARKNNLSIDMADIDKIEDSLFQKSEMTNLNVKETTLVSVKTKNNSRSRLTGSRQSRMIRQKELAAKSPRTRRRERAAIKKQQINQMSSDEEDRQGNIMIGQVMRTMHALKRAKSIKKTGKFDSNLKSPRNLDELMEELSEEEDTIRWVKVDDREMKSIYGNSSMDNLLKESDNPMEQIKKKCCQKKSKDGKGDDKFYTPEQIDQIDEELFTRLGTEKKARANWRKLMTMIQLVKALSSGEDLKKAKNLNDDQTVKSCWDFQWMNKYVMAPDNKFMTIWTAIALSVNTISIFLVYYEAAFRLSFIQQSVVITIFEICMTLEIFALFIKAYPSKDSDRGWVFSVLGKCGCCKDKQSIMKSNKKVGSDNDMWQKQFKKVARRYLSSFFIIDFLSVVPFFLTKVIVGTEGDSTGQSFLKVFAWFRLLRITQLPKILKGTNVYAQLLMHRFPTKSRMIYNVKQVIWLVLFLLLALHLTACVNIFQGTGEDSWIPVDENGIPLDKESFSLYIDQLYLMTTTMTTVGYGDLNAAKSPDFESPSNMTLLWGIQFVAIFTFTLIQDRIFSLQFDIKLNSIVSSARDDATLFLHEVDMGMKRQFDHKKMQGKLAQDQIRETLDQDVWNDLVHHMESTVRHSIFEVFQNESFYNDLPPRLQTKLVKSVLFNHEAKFDNFFRELDTLQPAPRPFINSLLSQLKSRLARVNTTLINQGCEVDRVYFFYKGSGMLTREFNSPVYGRNQLEIAELPEGSFYGELQCYLGIDAYFNLKTYSSKKQKEAEKIIHEGTEYCHIYELEVDKFKELCNDYPEFGSQIYVRAEIRVAYFKHECQLRMEEFAYKMKIMHLGKQIDQEEMFHKDQRVLLARPSEQPKDEDSQQNDVDQQHKVTNQSARRKAKKILAEQLAQLQRKLTQLYGPNFAADVVSAAISRSVINHDGMRKMDPMQASDQYLLLYHTTYHSNLIKRSDQDEFDIAAQSYIVRRARRIYLQVHNFNQVIGISSKRWNKCNINLGELIKGEFTIQEIDNSGLNGLQGSELLQLAQLAFKRRQAFVRNALEQREQYGIQFEKPEQVAAGKLLELEAHTNVAALDASVSVTPRSEMTHQNDELKADIMKRLSNKSRWIKYENMMVFARFKYDPDKPAFRLNIWDLLVEVSLMTVSFENQFAEVYERLYDEYEDQGFDEISVSELSGSEHLNSTDTGLDHIDQELIEAIDKINPHDNIFVETEPDDSNQSEVQTADHLSKGSVAQTHSQQSNEHRQDEEDDELLDQLSNESRDKPSQSDLDKEAALRKGYFKELSKRSGKSGGLYIPNPDSHGVTDLGEPVYDVGNYSILQASKYSDKSSMKNSNIPMTQVPRIELSQLMMSERQGKSPNSKMLQSNNVSPWEFTVSQQQPRGYPAMQANQQLQLNQEQHYGSGEAGLTIQQATFGENSPAQRSSPPRTSQGQKQMMKTSDGASPFKQKKTNVDMLRTMMTERSTTAISQLKRPQQIKRKSTVTMDKKKGAAGRANRIIDKSPDKGEEQKEEPSNKWVSTNNIKSDSKHPDNKWASRRSSNDFFDKKATSPTNQIQH